MARSKRLETIGDEGFWRIPVLSVAWHGPCLTKSVTAEWSAGARPKVQETEMFTSGRFAQVATAAVGALVLSTVSVGAAIGPASASGLAGTQTVSVQGGTQANG
ncbi:MAG TPA: hypothetical protein VEW71_03465 [Allosphingosinicella sp.]|nr:hypothetical protein [Allosphingosinicella sp.]